MSGTNRFYGLYRGVVVDDKDPMNKGRLKLRIPQVLGKTVTGLAWGVYQSTISKVTPSVGTGVWVVFEGGDPSFPVWLGAFEPLPVDSESAFSFGSFYDTTTQTAAAINTAYHVQLNNTDLSCTSGVSIINDENGKPTKIKVSRTGVYNFMFSFQMHNTGGGGSGSTAQIWFSKNEVTIPDSNTRVDVPSNAPYVVAAWNLFIKLNAGEYGQILWSTNNTSIEIQRNTSTAPGPGIPSAIVTVNQVS
jgi:hypothetical protein